MVLFLLFFLQFANGENLGTLLGQFNVYHHGVSGSVYSINSSSFYIDDFSYDGTAKDAYFWGGPTTSPGAQGFIIPFKGRTNVLPKLDKDSFVISLPEGKFLSDLKWISVYDLSKLENFADIYIPEGFEPPKVERLSGLISDDVTTDFIEVLDYKTIKLVGFGYSSHEEAYFYVGKGHVPNKRGGFIIPDENGYFEAIHQYRNEDVILTLPGETTIEQIDYFAIFDMKNDKSLAYINIPSDLNIPPSLKEIRKFAYSFGNCEELHRDLHVSWEVVGQTINIEIAAVLKVNDYVAFGISGSNDTVQMIGSDVAIGYLDGPQIYVNDYNIDSKAMCTKVLEQARGVCKDSDLGKPDSVQALEGKRVDGLTIMKYRRQISKSDDIDKEFKIGDLIPIVWAMGPMILDKPTFHTYFPKELRRIDFSRTEESNCKPFVFGWKERVKEWGTIKIVDSKLRNFNARLGPSAGDRGGSKANPGISWYIHNYITPELYLQRGVTYAVKVEGGNNPHDLQYYHPFVITDEPYGGPNQKLYLAGVETTRRGTRRATAAGRLCVFRHRETKDSRLDQSVPNFARYVNEVLKIRCEPGEPSILEITPNSSWPDIVYYNSYNGLNMGGKIHIFDDFSDAITRSSSTKIWPLFKLSSPLLCSLVILIHKFIL